MGVFDTYGNVQLKVGTPDSTGYKIGAKVNIPDGIYLHYEGVIVIHKGVFMAEFAQLFDNKGEAYDLNALCNSRNSIYQMLRQRYPQDFDDAPDNPQQRKEPPHET